MLPCVDKAPVVVVVPRPWAELPAIAPAAVEEVEPVAAEEVELDVGAGDGVASSRVAIIFSIKSRWAAVNSGSASVWVPSLISRVLLLLVSTPHTYPLALLTPSRRLVVQVVGGRG